MEYVKTNDLDINNGFFHFTRIDNRESIESYSTYLKKLNGEYKDNFEKVEAYCDVILDYLFLIGY